ncbi:MAG: response regulator, partial [Bdellovibrionales bacterium]|nr:response regulator [Bdellovibrionales bacterium]
MIDRMKILLIEDDPEHVDLINSWLTLKHSASINMSVANKLSKGFDLLDQEAFDVILLDLGLPDSTLDKTLGKMLPKAKSVPVVVLSSLEDEIFGINAVHEGAQDYICKSKMDGEILFRSLNYAIQRKKIEDELRQANQTKDEFLATLSHELRTPIGVIKGFAEMLMQKTLSEESREQALNAILRNAKLQVNLVEDLLDMSRIITGKFSLKSKSLELSQIIQDALDTVSLSAHNKHIEIHTYIDTAAGAILGDELRMHQVMWNLLSNAIKFTPKNGVISVRLKRINSQIIIEVQDSGEGIEEEFLPYVFDRFRQHDSSIRRQHGGLGLGLAIVKYIIELHGGQIKVNSEGKDKGSVFTISLPPMAIQMNDDVPVSIATKSSGKVEHRTIINEDPRSTLLAGVHVLVIDDSLDMLMLINFILKRYGAKVTTASSANEAHKFLMGKKPQIIICDISMPDEDGYTFIKKLRSREMQLGQTPIPAATLTAFTKEDEKKKAHLAGFEEFLSKPV